MTTNTAHLQTSNGAPYLLAAEHLQKTYDNIMALKGLSFSLRPGRIMGFLGSQWCREDYCHPDSNNRPAAHRG
jgi:hypothetical protein